VTRARMTSFPSQQGQNSTNSRLLSQVPGLIESFAMCQDISSAPKRPYTRRRRHRKYVDPLIFGLLNSVVCRPAQRVSLLFVEEGRLRSKVAPYRFGNDRHRAFLERGCGGISACIAPACRGTPPEILLIAF
jgi:hypothetical protein